MTTIDQLIEKYREVYYIEDPAVIPLVCAIILSNKLAIDPIWLMLVGASSSGKTELINAVSGVSFVHQVSTLTENTFLSGMRPIKGNEPSLLKRIGLSGVITMKDFTTILSMQFDRQQAIMSQLREIYDGHYVKETGTGMKVEWKGRITLLAGVTEKIHAMEGKFSGMGKRELTYTMVPQDRFKTTKRSVQNKKKMEGMRLKVQEAFTEYIYGMIDVVTESNHELTEKQSDEIIRLADFASIARSPVERNFKGNMSLVLSPDMPMRLANQISSCAAIFMAMNGGNIPDQEIVTLHKLALDSIPKGRRITLAALAKVHRANTPAIARALNYPTDQTRQWLEDLNVLGICERTTINGKNLWKLKDEYRSLIEKYEGITSTGEDAIVNDTSSFLGGSIDIANDTENDFKANDGFGGW